MIDWMPFGLGRQKPHHFREMARIAWENRDNLGYAWRVLTQGVCDGCALGTSGLSDWTIPGTHLCMVRLELLRLNTMPAMDPAALADCDRLRSMSSKELRALGRLAYPTRRRKGERGFERISWDDLWREVGERWRGFDPRRTAMYVTSRGITNEVYYVAQKVMRYLGSNNVDNSARLCHSPSTAALKGAIGVAATTCSYTDWFDADVIVFFGSNPANDQPVTTKYLAEARRRGARVLSVNTYREPGLERYWIPSSPKSALFGTRLCDRTFLVRVGGDLAFLNAVQKVLLETGAAAREFIHEATRGVEELEAALAKQSMRDLLAQSGSTIEDVHAFAREIASAERGVLVWSMGITQHAHGADTVRAIANLGLLREYVGRPGTGLMPIRGHSGVQGGAEMGAYSTAFPGGVAIDTANAERFSDLWGFRVPADAGLQTVDVLESAAHGGIDALYAIGGNFLETLPEPARVERALSRIPLRIVSDIVATTQLLAEPGEVVYCLPARTRYEQEGGGTETTTERRVVFSPHVQGHDVGEARSDWQSLLDLARSVKPENYAKVHFSSAAEIRADIERAVPIYAGIATLSKQGDQFQWGGPRLCTQRRFATRDGKAHFQPVEPPPLEAPRTNTFVLATRRGKQFNSMVQRDRDPLTGAERDHVLIAFADARHLGLSRGDALVLENETGRFAGRAFPADITPGTLQGHWPEVNVLIPRGRVDRDGGVPDYNATVRLSRA